MCGRAMEEVEEKTEQEEEEEEEEGEEEGTVPYRGALASTRRRRALIIPHLYAQSVADPSPFGGDARRRTREGMESFTCMYAS